MLRRNSSKRLAASALETPESRLMAFLQEDCPQDLLPKMLAFLEPSTTAALSRTNRFWRSLMQEEATWSVLCRDMYKVCCLAVHFQSLGGVGGLEWREEGSCSFLLRDCTHLLSQWKPSDPTPSSWKFYYRMNPCIPVDYRSAETALAALGQSQTLRLWLRPGSHYLSEPLSIHASHGARIVVETMQTPKNTYTPPVVTTAVTAEPLRKRPKKLRNMLRLKMSSEAILMDETERSDVSSVDSNPEPPKHATLVLRSRRSDQPAVLVRHGMVLLKGVRIQHSSSGSDIWNGNAAVQVQPRSRRHRPVAYLERVHVSSSSGRGIVAIDGGSIFLQESAVENCAATGVYIGGHGSRAALSGCDVVGNGVGNHRGIARGHSGIYVEQGRARIVDSNISRNTLTGISVVSHENARLYMENSDLIDNGTFQLEWPPLGSRTRELSASINNRMGGDPAESRTGLLADADT